MSCSYNLRSSTKPLIDKFYEHVPQPILTKGKCNYVDNVYISNETQRIKAIDIDEDGDELDLDFYNMDNYTMLKSPPPNVIKPKNNPKVIHPHKIEPELILASKNTFSQEFEYYDHLNESMG